MIAVIRQCDCKPTPSCQKPHQGHVGCTIRSKHRVVKMPIDWRQIEARSPLLAALPLAARQSVRMHHVSRTAQVFAKGDRPVAVYCIVSGAIKLVRRSIAGGEIVLQRARDGILAEASLDQPVYHCDAVATEDSDLIVILLKAFADGLADKVFRQAWVGHLARELRRVRTHAERLSLKTARERIVHYIETEGSSGEICLSQSKKDWAAEMSLSHEALYRSLATMARKHEISVSGSVVRLTVGGIKSRHGKAS